MWLMSGCIVLESHTFHSPTGSKEEANVSTGKRAHNVLDYMCMYVLTRGRGFRLHVFHVYHDSIYQWLLGCTFSVNSGLLRLWTGCLGCTTDKILEISHDLSATLYWCIIKRAPLLMTVRHA